MEDQTESASPGVSNQSRRQSTGLHLACRECQRKKIKCDRTYPCGQCTRSGLPCHSSTRKPRAKAGAKAVDAELRNRIAKLERLVESFQGDDTGNDTQLVPPVAPQAKSQHTSLPGSESTGARQNSDSPTSPIDAASSYTNKYVAGTFWSSLTSEVKALADAFEEDGALSDDDLASPGTTPPSAPYALDAANGAAAGYELILCPPGVLYVMPGALQDPTPEKSAELIHNFLQYVEPSYKIFHVPTLAAFLQEGQPYLHRAPDAPCNKALRASVYFAGINAYTEEECQATYGKPLNQMVQEFRRNVDVALYQADPLNTTETATLQALVLYVASVRVMDPSRRAWSLIGLLVRIARAMGIHREIGGESPFMAEIRRRLWYNIVFLDCYASVDRGSEPAIHPETFSRLLPLNVNDVDFDESSTSIASREGITDTSISLIAMEGSVLALKFSLPEDSTAGAAQSWQTRLELAYEYQRSVNDKFLRHCDPTNMKHHMMIIGTGTAAANAMILRAVRPIHIHPNSVPPRVDSPWVMELALNILRHANMTWEQLTGRWRRMPWVPWHAIGVALAGLCSIRGTDQANEAWILVEQSMACYGENVADSPTGMLWRPIAKLYQKAKAFRDQPEIKAAAPIPVNMDLAWNDPTVTQQPVVMNTGTAGPMDPMGMPADVFNFPPDMHASLPSDNSWLDWESILKDMDEIKGDDMLLM
ncbi:C6 transcription factor-like protein [Dothistroma septosporum NZE10]|uniref:C6 transcription factor-like protein n=1 Tax=Dothistroma septosporum (strain NZE10 / CBS 128990) TaxID=675120 RepID=N1PWW9_DOTSN|nr:C6 transcription factor-like protein [Dothistroma septosporum NZE10]